MESPKRFLFFAWCTEARLEAGEGSGGGGGGEPRGSPSRSRSLSLSLATNGLSAAQLFFFKKRDNLWSPR
jgi:hypothetical protein